MEQEKQFMQRNTFSRTEQCEEVIKPDKTKAKTNKTKVKSNKSGARQYHITFHNPNTAENTAAYVANLLIHYLYDK